MCILRVWHQQLESARKQNCSEFWGLHGLEFASFYIICLFSFSPWKLDFPLSEEIMYQYLPQMRNSADEDRANMGSKNTFNRKEDLVYWGWGYRVRIIWHRNTYWCSYISTKISQGKGFWVTHMALPKYQQ